MAKRYLLTARRAKLKPTTAHYEKAIRQLAFKQATVTASLVTTITAVGYFLALSEYALLLWGLEFFVVLFFAYRHAKKSLEETARTLDK